MARFRAAALIALASIVGFSSACREKKSAVDDTKLTIASTEDATKDLIDEDYRFRIRWPGKGWKLIHEADMRKISPDAVAGAVSDAHIWGAVIVERFSGDDVDAFARLIIGNIPLENKVKESETRIEFAGKQAKRYVLRGRISGMDARYVGVIFGHQGHIFQVLSWSQQAILTAGGAEAQPFFDAFSLLGGPVKGREQVIATVDTQGPGWRIRDGVFVSAVHQLRIKPPSGWRVAVGAELRNMNAEAEVALVASNPELYITVLAESSTASPADEAGLRRLGRERVEQAFGKSRPGASMEMPMAGAVRVFDRTIVEEPPFEFLTTGFRYQGEWIQVQAWYVSALRDADKARIRDGLAAIEFLSPDEAAVARAELTQAVDTQNAVGEHYSLRRGVYRDFAHKWRWRAPEAGFWRIDVGQEARAKQADARLSAEEAGASLLLRASSAVKSGLAGGLSLAAHSRDVEAALKQRGILVRAREPISLGSVPGTVLICDASLSTGAKAEYRALAAVGPGDVALRVDVWGSAAQMAKHSALVDSALAGFRFDPDLATTASAGEQFRDVRMGYAMRMGPEWRRRVQTPASLASLGSAVSFKNDRREVFVLALCMLDANRDDEWFFDLMEQRVRENLGALISGEPSKKTLEVAGEPARELVWKVGRERVYAYLVRRDYTLYMIMGSNLTDGEAELIRTRFAFVD